MEAVRDALLRQPAGDWEFVPGSCPPEASYIPDIPERRKRFAKSDCLVEHRFEHRREVVR